MSGLSLPELREAPRPKTTVVNLRRQPFDVYIGRAGHGQDGYFGNPFRVRDWKDPVHLALVLAQYRDYFTKRVESDAEFRRRVLDLRGKRLGCFCKPGPCHGDVISAWVDSQAPERVPCPACNQPMLPPSESGADVCALCRTRTYEPCCDDPDCNCPLPEATIILIAPPRGGES